MDIHRQIIIILKSVIELKPLPLTEDLSSQRPLKTLGLIKIQGEKFRANKIEKLGLVSTKFFPRIIMLQRGILFPEPSYDLPGMLIEMIKFPLFIYILLDFLLPPLPQSRHQKILDHLYKLRKRYGDIPGKVLKPLTGTLGYRTGLGFSGIYKTKVKQELFAAIKEYTEFWLELYRTSVYIDDPFLRKEIIKYYAEYRRYGKINSYHRKLFSFLVNKRWAERFLTDIIF